LLTDIDETVLTVEERLFWRERFESQSCKKKSVRFREFDDPENKCRFFTRPTDVEGMGHPSLEQNPLRDACPQAHYVTRSAPVFASFSHDPDRYVKKLRNREDGMNYVMLYTSL
uniref:FCP1 homology domain-containing protein n=1 Tax=Angiostrongylus cantonensis TaxID=6313 RepID=A0A0K0D5X7_ANGCA